MAKSVEKTTLSYEHVKSGDIIFIEDKNYIIVLENNQRKKEISIIGTTTKVPKKSVLDTVFLENKVLKGCLDMELHEVLSYTDFKKQRYKKHESKLQPKYIQLILSAINLSKKFPEISEAITPSKSKETVEDTGNIEIGDILYGRTRKDKTSHYKIIIGKNDKGFKIIGLTANPRQKLIDIELFSSSTVRHGFLDMEYCENITNNIAKKMQKYKERLSPKETQLISLLVDLYEDGHKEFVEMSTPILFQIKQYFDKKRFSDHDLDVIIFILTNIKNT